MKSLFALIITSVLTALGFSSCVGCNPGLVYGPPPQDRWDGSITTDTVVTNDTVIQKTFVQ